MMEFNSFSMNVLVEAHQAELRKSSRPPIAGRKPGPIRKALGTSLIRLGARLGGTTPAPVRTAVSSTLATP